MTREEHEAIAQIQQALQDSRAGLELLRADLERADADLQRGLDEALSRFTFAVLAERSPALCTLPLQR